MKTGSRRLHFVDLGSRCILRQLQLEEALLRNDSRSFVLLNRALPRERSIVLGTSGKAHEHVHVEKARADGVRLIRRYTGGGTVYIDNGTFFVSFVMSVNNVPHVESFPRPIMHWSSQLYKEVPADVQRACVCAHADPAVQDVRQVLVRTTLSNARERLLLRRAQVRR